MQTYKVNYKNTKRKSKDKHDDRTERGAAREWRQEASDEAMPMELELEEEEEAK